MSALDAPICTSYLPRVDSVALRIIVVVTQIRFRLDRECHVALITRLQRESFDTAQFLARARALRIQRRQVQLHDLVARSITTFFTVIVACSCHRRHAGAIQLQAEYSKRVYDRPCPNGYSGCP